MQTTKKGFTLIELLIVIAIVAILSAVVILTLNPAQLLAQSRDSNRISDMATLKSAISLYLADVSVPILASSTTGYNSCYYSHTTALGFGVANTCGDRFTAGSAANTGSLSRGVDSTGWIPVNFNDISSGSPLGNLPTDPTNSITAASTTSYYYAYKAEGTTFTFEVNANMESNKYKNGGGSDVESTDGGNSPDAYEVGTDPGLDL